MHGVFLWCVEMNAVAEEKMTLAVSQLAAHKITMRKAAELAGVPYIVLFNYLCKEGVDSGYSLEDFASYAQGR